MEDKKRKVETATNWEEKSIEEFQLLPPPGDWKLTKSPNSVWNRYYHDRLATQKREAAQSSESCFERKLLKKWRSKLNKIEGDIRKTMDDFPPWGKNTNVEIVALDLDYDEVRTVEYRSTVWSPYAVPSALQLEHRYHVRSRSNSVEFFATWSYLIKDYLFDVDYEDDDDLEMKQLCSNCYEDEVLRADVIKVGKLNARTVAILRKALLGTESVAFLDDFSFLQLLFTSMATPNFDTLQSGGIGYAIGYFWRPKYGTGIQEKMEAEGIDFMGVIGWLEYQIRLAAGALRPMDKYYEAPTIRDAMGYDYCRQQRRR